MTFGTRKKQWNYKMIKNFTKFHIFLFIITCLSFPKIFKEISHSKYFVSCFSLKVGHLYTEILWIWNLCSYQIRSVAQKVIPRITNCFENWLSRFDKASCYGKGMGDNSNHCIQCSSVYSVALVKSLNSFAEFQLKKDPFKVRVVLYTWLGKLENECFWHD